MGYSRELNLSDIDKFHNLVVSNTKFYQRLIDSNLVDFNDFESFFLIKNYVRFGYFDDEDRLQCSIAVKVYPKLPGQAAITLMLTNFQGQFNVDKSGIESCLSKAVEYIESNKMYTIYTSRNIKFFQVQSRRDIWKPDTRHDWRRRYVSFVEAYVPPNELTKSDFYNSVLGNIPLPYWQVISSLHLKDKYRHLDQNPRISGRQH
jgi:hypothetical protein